MSARAIIRTELDELASKLRRRGIIVDVSVLRELRDYGLACFGLGYEHAHNAPTIPVRAADGDEPEITIDHESPNYSRVMKASQWKANK